MRRPALTVVLVFLCGLLADHYLTLPLFPLLAGGLLSGTLAVWLGRRHSTLPRVIALCACLSLLSASAFWYTVRTGVASRHHLSRVCDLPEPITIAGTVAADPDCRERYTLVTVEASQAVIGGHPVRLTGRLLVRLGAPRTSCAYGDRVRVTGRLRRPDPARNPGGFDARAFYEQHGIAGLMSVRDPARLTILSRRTAPTFHTFLIRPMKQAAERTIDATLRGPSAALLKGVLLGEKQALPEDILSAFSDTGLTHLLAVSGFNVGLIAIIAMTVLGLLRLPRTPATVGTLVVIILYAFITNLTPSVVRASIMAGLFLIANLIDRQTDPLNVLSVAALLILILWPQAVFDLSFQLSFAATLSLIVVYPWMRERLPAGLRRANTWWKRWLIEGLVVSSAAQVGTLPLIAWAFSKVSLIAPAANLFVAPLVLIATALGSATVLSGLISVEVARLFSAANWLALQGMMHVAAVGASIPSASLIVSRPPLAVMAGYYLTLLLIIHPPRSPVGRRGLVALLVVGLAGLGWGMFLRPRDLVVTFLDVGQGDAVVVECPNGYVLLVDGGNREPEFDAGERVVLPFLRFMGSRRVNAVLLTHPHNDHLGGLPAVLEGVGVDEVIDSGIAPETPAFRHWLDAIKARRVRYRTTAAGDSLRGMGDVRGVILHPSSDFTGSTGDPPYGLNNASVVLRLDYRAISVLLTGDVEDPAEAGLIEQDVPLRSTVVKVPHHGSSTSSGLTWVEAVRPRAAVISVGAWNRFGHPDPQVIDRYRRLGTAVYRTDEAGAVVLRTDGRSFRLEPTIRRGRERPLLTPSQALGSILLTGFRENLY